jgi:hypothetical protein
MNKQPILSSPTIIVDEALSPDKNRKALPGFIQGVT